MMHLGSDVLDETEFKWRYDTPLAVDRLGKSEWGTTAALLHQWQASVWPVLPPDVAFSLHGLLSTCDSCYFERSQPAVLLRGARVFRTDSKAQCIGCAPHSWSEKRSVQKRWWVPNATRAHTFREMWDEVPLSELDTVFQSTFRLVLFPVTDLELIDAIMNLAPIREVTVRQGAVLYDVERWLTPRVTRLSLHSAECVTDHTLLQLLGHVQHLTSLHLVSVPVTDGGLQQLLPELTRLTELVIADTSISVAVLQRLKCKSTLRKLHFQVQSPSASRRPRTNQKDLVNLIKFLPQLDDFSVVLPFDAFYVRQTFTGLMAPGSRNFGRWKRLSLVHLPDASTVSGVCWTRFGGFREGSKFSFANRSACHRDFRFISMRTLGTGSDLFNPSYTRPPPAERAVRRPPYGVNRLDYDDDDDFDARREDDWWLAEEDEEEEEDEYHEAFAGLYRVMQGFR